MAKAKRHFNNIVAASKGKKHKLEKKSKRAAGELEALLKHNNRVAEINSTPPVFTLWQRSSDAKCSAAKCLAKDSELSQECFSHILPDALSDKKQVPF